MILNFLKSKFQSLKKALTKSFLGEKIRQLFRGSIDEEKIDQLEQIFYEADLGFVSAALIEKVKEIYKQSPDTLNVEDLINEIKKELIEQLKEEKKPSLQEEGETKTPYVVLLVGVNGNGKTTCAAKLAKKYLKEGKKVILAATDTYRAAGIEQLDMWAKRLKIDIVKGSYKSDPAAVAFDAIEAAKSRSCDVLIIDTAGRLHTREDLMHELKKIRASCQKVQPNTPHETILVLDATIGQNAIDQAKIFHQFTPISGLFLTKLDGTAKGGAVVAIQDQLRIPIYYIGLGEGIEDLQVFDPEEFVNALLG